MANQLDSQLDKLLIDACVEGVIANVQLQNLLPYLIIGLLNPVARIPRKGLYLDLPKDWKLRVALSNPTETFNLKTL